MDLFVVVVIVVAIVFRVAFLAKGLVGGSTLCQNDIHVRVGSIVINSRRPPSQSTTGGIAVDVFRPRVERGNCF